MRRTPCIVFLTVDDLIQDHGGVIAGFDEFSASLDHAGIPSVWLTNGTRLQIDEPRRKMGHSHPFIAEDGCGVFLPEDYFHLRPQRQGPRESKGTTLRLGRFTCLPVAEPQPAATTALEVLATESSASVVPLRSLAPRELAENMGLHPRDAEMARQRDFDELFFFAGASSGQIEQFQIAAASRNVQLRRRGALWSLAVGASVVSCIRELSKLYDRALHNHARNIAIVTNSADPKLLSTCDRVISLIGRRYAVDAGGEPEVPPRGHRVIEVPLNASDTWERLNSYICGQR